MNERTELPDGIYFDLSFEDYLAQERISSSALTALMEGPSAFWAKSWMNPDKPERVESDAMLLGTAYHCARLEPGKFADLYNRELVVEDLAEEGFTVLRNGTEIGVELGERGATKKKAGEGVMQQAERLDAILQEDPDHKVRIWPLAERIWRDGLYGRTPIAPKYWAEILRDMERIRDNAELAELITGGVAEVSILWTDPESGVRCKCRPDYLGADFVTHLKTWDARTMGKPGNMAIADQFRFNYHYRTGWFYRLGLEAMPNLAFRSSDGKSMTYSAMPKNVAELARGWIDEKTTFTDYFLFVRRSGIPDIRARRVKYFTLPPGVEAQDINTSTRDFRKNPSVIARKADMEVRRCFALFNECCEIYGIDGEVWYPRDMLGDIEDADFSPYWLDETLDPR